MKINGISTGHRWLSSPHNKTNNPMLSPSICQGWQRRHRVGCKHWKKKTVKFGSFWFTWITLDKLWKFYLLRCVVVCVSLCHYVSFRWWPSSATLPKLKYQDFLAKQHLPKTVVMCQQKLECFSDLQSRNRLWKANDVGSHQKRRWISWYHMAEEVDDGRKHHSETCIIQILITDTWCLDEVLKFHQPPFTCFLLFMASSPTQSQHTTSNLHE